VTYCVGLCLRAGIIMLADTRTNAGVDNISTFSKLQVSEQPGERVIGICTAGNLAITQAVLGHLQEGVPLDGQRLRLGDVANMFQAARLVGAAVRAVFAADGPSLAAQGIGFDCSLLVGGQIGAEAPRLFLIYSAGNFIEATADTPFLQIGEHKYGKPILDRALTFDTSLSDGLKLALVSMDSTLRSNLMVGLPMDLLMLRRDGLRIAQWRRIADDDPYFTMVRHGWSGALRAAYLALPAPDWA
jgi:putative proteasome-type protease